MKNALAIKLSKIRTKQSRRNSTLKRKYGITLNDYEFLLQQQNNKCQICGTKKTGAYGTFNVDHNHELAFVRSLLCFRCNQLLGMAKENVEILQNAINYLAKENKVFNRAILVGRLGGDPELKYTQSNKAVVNFSLATTKRFKNNEDEWQNKTVWHKIVAWGQLAENINQYLSKGSLVHVEGEIDNRSYETNEGGKRYISEIIASNVQFLDQKSEEPTRESVKKTPTRADTLTMQKRASTASKGKDKYVATNDDIPF